MERRQPGSVAALRMAARHLSAPTRLTQHHTPGRRLCLQGAEMPTVCASPVTVLSFFHLEESTA